MVHLGSHRARSQKTTNRKNIEATTELEMENPTDSVFYNRDSVEAEAFQERTVKCYKYSQVLVTLPLILTALYIFMQANLGKKELAQVQEYYLNMKMRDIYNCH